MNDRLSIADLHYWSQAVKPGESQLAAMVDHFSYGGPQPFRRSSLPVWREHSSPETCTSLLEACQKEELAGEAAVSIERS